MSSVNPYKDESAKVHIYRLDLWISDCDMWDQPNLTMALLLLSIASPYEEEDLKWRLWEDCNSWLLPNELVYLNFMDMVHHLM